MPLWTGAAPRPALGGQQRSGGGQAAATRVDVTAPGDVETGDPAIRPTRQGRC
ncbi:hypothetical protein [Amycolatopsis keratiniphila]|uniref:hypothetical protein n=1 Tax=Amycolatopsis keratiniphila TaxID=129921 RepID=UPI00130E68AF|nr:hypothetical protein [Amycolatopsis keratiniphila]